MSEIELVRLLKVYSNMNFTNMVVIDIARIYITHTSIATHYSRNANRWVFVHIAPIYITH
jgi:hypothetical protein